MAFACLMISVKSSRMKDTIKMVIDPVILLDEAWRPLHPVSVFEALYNLAALSMSEPKLRVIQLTPEPHSGEA